ncbi:hypothetical protein ACTFIZ_006457 [Dictyostelium cf. discoideum]
MSTVYVTLGSLNAGIQKGDSLKNTYRDQIKAELFLDKNSQLIENYLLNLQEIGQDFQDYRNYGNLKNKTNSTDKSKKENQLRIIYSNKKLKVIEEVQVDEGSRLQIVSFKLGGVYFVLINCHIPQKKSRHQANKNFFILERLVSNLNFYNIPFLIAGDINHWRVDIIEKLGKEISFANINDEKTTGKNSIDHLMYSSQIQSSNFQVLKNAVCSTEKAKINHYPIRSTFKINKGSELKPGDIQMIYNHCYNDWMNHLQQNNIKEEMPRKNQNTKKDITGNENKIPDNELCEKVKSKFEKENKKWSLNKFHTLYFKNIKCSYEIARQFFKGESKNPKCRTILTDYLKK